MKNNFFKVVVSKLKNALFWGSNNFLQGFSSKTKNPLFEGKKNVFKTQKNVKGSLVPIFTKNINI